MFFDEKKANILIDQNGHACLTDFGLLAIVSDPTYPTPSGSVVACGTVRWMSPELLPTDQRDLKDSRPTKKSDCYALGMVIYEVLDGQAPFGSYKEAIVMRKIIEGERPERPGGAQGVLFADDLWKMLNLCWEKNPENRPDIEVVSKTLNQISGTWESLPPQTVEDGEGESGLDLTVLSVGFLVLTPSPVHLQWICVLIKPLTFYQKLTSEVQTTSIARVRTVLKEWRA